VPSETDTPIEQHDLATEAVEPVDGRTAALTDTTDAEDVAEAETDQNSDSAEAERDSKDGEPAEDRRSINWSTIFAFVVLPALALLLAVAAGYLKWQNTSDHSSRIAGIESVAAAKDATIGLLSYKPDTVDKDLDGARDRLTGTFKDSYTQLAHDVVIPGAKQKRVSATATVPAAASVEASPNHAVVLLYVNQTTIIGTDAPTDSVSTVRVTLDNVHGRWLVSEFDPI
jgi:Mce-associated membrane protein